ncbi:MAG TPA: tetratricopeptide repeat protein [Burkholderiales bacterium]|jgi:hypothetical protein|nr:tetratricopeptide repeat protein [Burkholderiales bacterium]
MPLIGAISLLIQFSFAYHALKTGRPYWWIFVIMAFPVMGCVIYYFVEVFPGSREHRKAHKTARKLARVLQPDAALKKRAGELEICGSVDNKISLAEECMAHQMYAEATKLYESCMVGPFASDGNVLFGLTRACVENNDWTKAAAAIAKLKSQLPTFRSQDVRLLEARMLEGRGDTDAAIALYRDLIPMFVGLEARYRYGLCLSRLGQHEAASSMFNEVLAHAKRFASALDEEQQWASSAKRALSQS